MPPDPAPHAAKPRAASPPGARAVLARFARCAPPMPPDPVPHAAKPRAASPPGARAVLARFARCAPPMAASVMAVALPVAVRAAAPTFSVDYVVSIRRGDPGHARVRWV